MSRLLFALALVSILVSVAPVGAEWLPTWPLRQLTVQADAVLLVQPLTQEKPGTFRVRAAFLGTSYEPGDVITVAHFDHYFRAGEQLDWRNTSSALLFVRQRRPTSAGAPLELLDSGLRICQNERSVWWPVQPKNPGPYVMTPEFSATWTEVVDRVRSDCSEVQRLKLARERSNVSGRNDGILSWLQRQRSSLTLEGKQPWLGITLAAQTGNVEPSADVDFAPSGWGDLQIESFQSIFASGGGVDSWRALSLHAEVYRGATPASAASAFATPAGRALLLALARDPRELAGARARALRLLADPTIVKDQPTPIECQAMVNGLLPLLTQSEGMLRAAGAHALRRYAVIEPTSAGLEVLSKAFKVEPPGPVHNVLAEVLHELAGPARWPTLSNRAGSALALLRDLQWQDDKVVFWLTLQTKEPVSVAERPTLFLERIDRQGKSLETKKLPLPATSPPNWKSGWVGSPLHSEVKIDELKAGTWRLRVVGIVGLNKTAWEAEPRTFQVVIKGEPAQQTANIFQTILMSLTGEAIPARQPEQKPERRIILDGEPL